MPKQSGTLANGVKLRVPGNGKVTERPFSQKKVFRKGKKTKKKKPVKKVATNHLRGGETSPGAGKKGGGRSSDRIV